MNTDPESVDKRVWYQCKDCGVIRETYPDIWSHVNEHFPWIARPWKSYEAHSSKIIELPIRMGHGDER
jgi:hypothetical protein